MFSKECDGRGGKTTILGAEIKMVTISKLPWASTTSLSLSLSLSLSVCLSVCLSLSLSLCVCVFHMCVHTFRDHKSASDPLLPRLGVTGGYELPDVGAGN